MGMPEDHRSSTPNLYKQGTTSIESRVQIKSAEERDSEGLKGRLSRGRRKSREIDSEKFSAAPILELRFQTKFSLEPKVRNKVETTNYFFSAKKPKGNNCLPYTCLICHIPKQMNKFVRPFSFLSSPLYSTNFVNTYIIDKDNSLEKFESVVFFFLWICELQQIQSLSQQQLYFGMDSSQNWK